MLRLPLDPCDVIQMSLGIISNSILVAFIWGLTIVFVPLIILEIMRVSRVMSTSEAAIVVIHRKEVVYGAFPVFLDS